jgi:hypothetical protein
VLVLQTSKVEFRQVQLILSAMAFDVGWAQNWAQFSGVHPCSETDFLGTLAVVTQNPKTRQFRS